MVSTRPLISKSCTNPLVIVPKAPITIGITVSFVFHSFFSSLARSWYLSFFWLSFNFTLWSAGTAKFTIRQVFFLLFLFFYWLSLGLVVRPRFGDLFVSQNPFSLTDSGLYIYHLFVWSNFNFLHISLWINLSTQSSLVFYSFCANLLHSLMWLIVSFLYNLHLHLIYCCFDIISLYGVVLCCY